MRLHNKVIAMPRHLGLRSRGRMDRGHELKGTPPHVSSLLLPPSLDLDLHLDFFIFLTSLLIDYSSSRPSLAEVVAFTAG